MSIIRRGSVFDPFSFDVWDPFGSSFSGFLNDALSVPRSNFVSDTAAFANVKAAMENGVLTVTVPKKEVKKPEIKSIEISS
ncbi:HSP20-like chaperones domain-containing protein [Dioscorea alata]|uniref:HSP20-like chaperones domain-containing protein n=1 Tax=Dioscorea alata TaxID=55571 RepID=A0ACB7V9L9_DIOAL|nr:HSP20-like chaperones domain-containing protein [Dioscorea alata]